MIIVTGGAGMIGSRVVNILNKKGIDNIIIVDNLKNGKKFFNLKNLKFKDFIQKEEFLDLLKSNSFNDIECIFHLGACSNTTEWDGEYLIKNNYEYTKTIFFYCQKNHIQLIYASSASVYGVLKSDFSEITKNESPVNMYSYSKYLFDQFLRQQINKLNSQVIGLRYFNVYGPNESHKGAMASTIFHFNNQVLNDGKVRLFKGSDEFGDGEQLRDFVYVDDCAEVNTWFLENKSKNLSGIYNVGTGESRTFNDVAQQVIKYHKTGTIEYIDFPSKLFGSYQSYTQANLNKLNSLINNNKLFRKIDSGILTYLNLLNK